MLLIYVIVPLLPVYLIYQKVEFHLINCIHETFTKDGVIWENLGK